MQHQAPFWVILLAQGMSCASELFGQRLSRRCHQRSGLRMLISMSMYCSLQAFVVLGLAQLLLPEQVTGGQGSLSMWVSLWEHPFLLGNAVNNSVYWLALSILIREPLGSLLVVLAFVSATFLVTPLQVVLGLSSGRPTAWASVLLSLCGTVMVACELPARTSDSILAAVARRCLRREPIPARDAVMQRPPHASSAAATASAGDLSRAAIVHGSDEDATLGGGHAEASMLLPPPPLRTGHLPVEESTARSAGGGATVTAAAATGTHVAIVGGAFAILALTTGIGVVYASCSETFAGLNSFGYTAVDQVLLPLTTLPMAALLNAFFWTRSAIGEPSSSFSTQKAEAGAKRQQLPAPAAAGPSRLQWEGDEGPAAVDAAPPTFLAMLELTFAELNGRAGSSGAARRPLSAAGVSVDGDGDDLGEGAQPPIPVGAARAPRRLSLGGQGRTPLASEGDAVGSGGRHDEGPGSENGGGSNSHVLGSHRAPAPAVPGGQQQPPTGYWGTLVPFHGIEFARSLLFFYLVTQFDVASTYFTMTLVRIVLVWVVSLVACTLLGPWVGVSAEEARQTLHPVSVGVKLVGSVLLVLAMGSGGQQSSLLR